MCHLSVVPNMVIVALRSIFKAFESVLKTVDQKVAQMCLIDTVSIFELNGDLRRSSKPEDGSLSGKLGS